ncbi:MAG: PEP-CTERM sorting domain-containing protein, partial [Gaiellaceae bacterium]
DYNGPAGDRGVSGTTDVSSYEGISGIVHRQNGMFLVGVFLTDAPPAKSAPPRLDFTKREQFDLLAPRTGQTFLVGDGKGHKYKVPQEATRLFLGFADAYLYQGVPGWYDNNDGYLNVSVDVASE